MSSKNFYFFIGTTTELIKVAPIIREFEKRKINFKIITSGQTDVNFSELSFLIKKRKTDISLGSKFSRSSVLLFFIWILKTLVKSMFLGKEFRGLDKKSTHIIVHGDPVSSLIGAMVAKFYRLKLVHIESGLRSFNFFEPFPEEICRFLISKLAHVHFSPNEWSLNNLAVEKGQKVNTFENTQMEACLSALKMKTKFKVNLNLREKKYFVLIIHRQEHVIFGKEESKRLLKSIMGNFDKKLLCVFITHATTLNFLKSVNFKLSSEEEKRVMFVERLRYIDFVNLLNNAEFVITDGGTNQEEAYYMGLPCLLLRSKTERIEGLGENVVLSKNKTRIIKSFMANYKNYRRDKIKTKIKPSKIVVDYLVSR